MNIDEYVKGASDQYNWQEIQIDNELNEDLCDCGQCAYYGLFDSGQHNLYYKYGNVQICSICFKNFDESIASYTLRSAIREDARISRLCVQNGRETV